MDVVPRRILSGVLLLLFALSGGYATSSPRVTSPVRIEISIAEREAAEQDVRPRPARIRDRAEPLDPQTSGASHPIMYRPLQRPPHPFRRKSEFGSTGSLKRKPMLKNILRGFRRAPRKSALELALQQRDQLALLSDEQLRAEKNGFAKAAVVAERVLGLRPHDEQILGAMAMAGGAIAEMQTGEGKTLAAVLAVAAMAGEGPVHVLTANDYLARRDAGMDGRHLSVSRTVGRIHYPRSCARRASRAYQAT